MADKKQQPSKTLRYAQPNRGMLTELPEETMADRHLRVQCDPVWRCGTNNFEREGSVLDWRKALPIGNGDFGAAIHGYPDNYTFHIAKNDVWWDNLPGPDPYPSMNLAELRRRVAAGDPSVKHDIRQTAETGVKPEPVPTGCARLTLQLCRSGTFYNVKEYLNMMNATASTEFCVSQNGLDGGAFWIQSMVSRLEEVLVIKLRPAGKNMGRLRFELGRDPLELHDRARANGWETEAALDTKFVPKAETDGRLCWFTMPLSGGDHYTVMLGSNIENLQVDVVGSDLIGRARPQDGELAIYVTVVSSHDATDTVAEARRRIERALVIGIGTIWSEHSSWWNRYWKRSWVALPKGMSERSWYWGLYKAGSARRPGKVCPGYGAPWRKGNYLNWGSFTLGYEETKYNLGLLPTNHAELLEPWIAVVRRTLEKSRASSQRFYGMPGGVPFGMSWLGEPVSHVGLYASTPMCVYTAGEAVKCAWDYYAFTGDLGFLRDFGYPLLKEVALFYRAYLQADENGRLVIFPSRCNEHDSWCEGLDDFMCNSVLDIAMFRQVFRNAAAAATLLGVDAELAADWTAARARLAAYPTWPDGTWKPSEDHINRGYELMLCRPELFDLWPVSVGEEIDAWHGTETERQQALASYRKYLGHHPLNTWDRCFPFLVAARMGDRDFAGKILAHLQTIPEAGNINRADPPDAGEQDGHCPFAVDAGSAFPAEVVTEFLLQSHAGDLRLFPAAPLTGHYAFHSLRTRGAFLVSSEFRDGKVPYALIQSLRGNPCRVANPFGQTRVRVRDLDTGRILLEQNVAADALVEFSTEIGHTIVVEQSACPLEDVPVVQLR